MKLHSPFPYFLLTALLGLVPVLNNKYPTSFFPALSPWWVEVISVMAGTFTAFMAFTRGWVILEKRSRARTLVREVAAGRHASTSPEENDLNISGRYIARLMRNADEDLREIKPDFSMASLSRLQRYLPELLKEIENEESARIRLGVVGAYLGEALCRNRQWEWYFKTDPALRQFSYLVSVIRKQGREWDPFTAAEELLIGSRKVNDILKEVS